MLSPPMSHVVMQSAEFPTAEAAKAGEAELQRLFDAYVRFEKEDASPWRAGRVPPPLVEFGKRHGIDWPSDEGSRFQVKGLFPEEAHLLRVDRALFFWVGGFDLGGDTLRGILTKLGAKTVSPYPYVFIRNADPDGRIGELAAFLDGEDFEQQYSVDDGVAENFGMLFSVTAVAPDGRQKRIWFNDSGVQDWAFTNILPQLDGEDPRIEAGATE